MSVDRLSDTSERQLAAWRCVDAILQFTAAFDEGDLPGMLQHFMVDGLWNRHDGAVHGHAGLAAMMANRPSGVFVRHVLSNHRTQTLSESCAVVESYVSVYRHDFVSEIETPAPLNGPDTIARYRDELTLHCGVWRIAVRQVTVDFKRRKGIA